MSQFFVECTATIYGRKHYHWPERESEDTGKRTTILNIATGQLENIVRVLEVNLEDRTADDVTEDIALEVIEVLEDMPRSQSLRDFLENQCPEAWAEFCREKEAA